MLSVKDFGAVGDGVTDDIAAFRAALTTAKVVFVPVGTYSLSDTLYIGYKCGLYGVGQASTLQPTLANKDVVTVGMGASLVDIRIRTRNVVGYAATALGVYGGGLAGVARDGTFPITHLRGLTVDGGGTAGSNSGNGVRLYCNGTSQYLIWVELSDSQIFGYNTSLSLDAPNALGAFINGNTFSDLFIDGITYGIVTYGYAHNNYFNNIQMEGGINATNLIYADTAINTYSISYFDWSAATPMYYLTANAFRNTITTTGTYFAAYSVTDLGANNSFLTDGSYIVGRSLFSPLITSTTMSSTSGTMATLAATNATIARTITRLVTSTADLELQAKSSRVLYLVAVGNATVNYVQINAEPSGTSPGIYAAGADTDIELAIIPKGVGAIRLGGRVVAQSYIRVATYGCVGCSSAPTSTSIGDFTSTRLFQGSNQAIDTLNCSGVGVTCTKTGGTYNITVSAASGVTSITGTTDQITASSATGAVTVSIPSTFTSPGSVTSTTNTNVGTVITGGGTQPSFVFGLGANCASSATGTLDGTNQMMYLSFTTGTGSCGVNSNIAVFTFGATAGVTTRWNCAVNAAQGYVPFWVDSTATTFSIRSSATALDPSTLYAFQIGPCSGY